MRLIYLAGPYTSPDPELRQHRVDQFAKALAFFRNKSDNLCLYSPVMHWHEVAKNHQLPTGFDSWMHQDFHMIKLSKAMWVLPLDGWRNSYGLAQEIEFAQSINRDIILLQPIGDSFILTDENLPDPLPLKD